MKDLPPDMHVSEKNKEDLDSSEDIEYDGEVVAFPPSPSLPNSRSECMHAIISLSLSPYPFSEQQEDVVSHAETERCRLLSLNKNNNNNPTREIERDKKPQVITFRTRSNKSKLGSLPWRGVIFWVA